MFYFHDSADARSSQNDFPFRLGLTCRHYQSGILLNYIQSIDSSEFISIPSLLPVLGRNHRHVETLFLRHRPSTPEMDLFIKSMLPQLKELWLTWEKEDDGHFDLSLLDVSQLTELSFRVSMKITVDSSGTTLLQRLKAGLPRLKHLHIQIDEHLSESLDATLHGCSKLSLLGVSTRGLKNCPLSGPELCSKISAICHKNSATLQEVELPDNGCKLPDHVCSLLLKHVDLGATKSESALQNEMMALFCVPISRILVSWMNLWQLVYGVCVDEDLLPRTRLYRALDSLFDLSYISLAARVEKAWGMSVTDDDDEEYQDPYAIDYFRSKIQRWLPEIIECPDSTAVELLGCLVAVTPEDHETYGSILSALKAILSKHQFLFEESDLQPSTLRVLLQDPWITSPDHPVDICRLLNNHSALMAILDHVDVLFAILKSSGARIFNCLSSYDTFLTSMIRKFANLKPHKTALMSSWKHILTYFLRLHQSHPAFNHLLATYISRNEDAELKSFLTTQSEIFSVCCSIFADDTLIKARLHHLASKKL
jgi:hypothetical protein